MAFSEYMNFKENAHAFQENEQDRTFICRYGIMLSIQYLGPIFSKWKKNISNTLNPWELPRDLKLRDKIVHDVNLWYRVSIYLKMDSI